MTIAELVEELELSRPEKVADFERRYPEAMAAVADDDLDACHPEELDDLASDLETAARLTHELTLIGGFSAQAVRSRRRLERHENSSKLRICAGSCPSTRPAIKTHLGMLLRTHVLAYSSSRQGVLALPRRAGGGQPAALARGDCTAGCEAVPLGPLSGAWVREQHRRRICHRRSRFQEADHGRRQGASTIQRRSERPPLRPSKRRHLEMGCGTVDRNSIDEQGWMRESDERDAHESIRRLGVVAPLAKGI